MGNAYRNLSTRRLIQRAAGKHGPNKSLAVPARAAPEGPPTLFDESYEGSRTAYVSSPPFQFNSRTTITLCPHKYVPGNKDSGPCYSSGVHTWHAHTTTNRFTADAAAVQSALSNVPDVFVVDAAVGSFRGSEVLVRAVTDDAAVALFLQHLLVRTGGASTAETGSAHPIKVRAYARCHSSVVDGWMSMV
jgi:hypothetical protein